MTENLFDIHIHTTICHPRFGCRRMHVVSTRFTSKVPLRDQSGVVQHALAGDGWASVGCTTYCGACFARIVEDHNRTFSPDAALIRAARERYDLQQIQFSQRGDGARP